MENTLHPLVKAGIDAFPHVDELLTAFQALRAQWPHQYDDTLQGFRDFVGDIKQCLHNESANYFA